MSTSTNPFGEDNLERLCEKFLGTTINCTCDIFKLHVDGKTVDFCMYAGQTSMDPFSPTHSTGQVVFAAISLLISVLGVFGNFLVMAAYRKRKLTFHQKLVDTLAVADLLFAIVTIIYIAPFSWTSLWYYSEWGCKLLSSIVTLGAYVAIGVILIIAIERYYGIVYPFDAGISSNSWCYGLLCLNFVLALAAIVPRMVFLNVHKESRQCTEQWPGEKDSTIYSWTLFIFYSILPVLIITAMYRRIYNTLNKSSMVCKVLTGTVNNNMRVKRLQDNHRIMKKLVTVLLVFVLCTFPSKVKWIIFDMVGGYKTINPTTYYVVNYVCDVFYFFHVLVNPVVYTVSDKTFRLKVKMVFGSGIRRKIFFERRVKGRTNPAKDRISTKSKKGEDQKENTKHAVINTAFDGIENTQL